MSKRGWHQDALDRAHESLATLKADQLAAQNAMALHLEQQLVSKEQDNETTSEMPATGA
jgi:hypothetical protein